VRRLTLLVSKRDAGQRIDRFIAERGGISRGLARRALDTGGVFVEGHRCKVASRGVHPGQRIEVNLEEGGRAAEASEPLDRARLLYADADLAVVDKPAGVPAQPTLTSDRGTLPELVSALLESPATLVHRLDRETSGVTVFARSAAAAAALTEAFRSGGPEKTYLALTARPPSPPEGRLEAALGKDPSRPGLRRVSPGGDPAATRYRTLASGPGGALVEARPETGRTHQIRVHLAHLDAPLLGDARYGGPRRVGELAVPRVMLHALRLELPHPITGAPLAFQAPVPEDFRAVCRALVGPSPLP
jgi:23S rRNA pseudouridine1911/1915/1917 synthase